MAFYLVTALFLFSCGAFLSYKIMDRQRQKEKQKIYEGKKEAMALEDRMWHEQETEFVFELSEKLSLVNDETGCARQVVESVKRFLNAGKVVVLLTDKEKKALRIAYSFGLDDEKVPKSFALPVGKGIAGHVMAQQKPLMVDNLERDFYLKRMNQEPYLLNSFVTVPLIFQDKVFGVVHACDKTTGRSFMQREVALLSNIARVAAIAFEGIRLNQQVHENYLETITVLALTIDARDTYTRFHSDNVARYAQAIAEKMDLGREDIDMIYQAALLHDIGKIALSDSILLKPDRLTDAEFNEIKKHPARGAEIIGSLPFLQEMSCVIRHHHERYDGKGYPDGLRAEAIELGARILGVADAFDAMTTDRPYRKALTLHEAREELEKNKGTQFDPLIAERFIHVLSHNPSIMYRKK